MSWLATITVENGVVLEDSVTQSNVEVDYHDDQLGEALKAAAEIIASGVVGPRHGTYRITLSGHGNPDHLPLEGWSNDSVTVNIYQV